MRVNRLQLFSVPLMAFVAALGLAGVLGESKSEIRSRVASVGEVAVRYPDRLRYQQRQKLEVVVRNTGHEVMSAIAVEVDRNYLQAFSMVEMIPQADEVTGRGYRIQLGAIPPGEERHLTAHLEAEEHGRHRGTIAVRSGERELARVELATIIFP